MNNEMEKEKNDLVSVDDSSTEQQTVVDETEMLAEEAVETETPVVEEYYQTKDNDHQEIVRLIEVAENELADLRLRKSLMEADFDELLSKYKSLILTEENISTIAKKTLLEYFSYELMKPLTSVGLKPADAAYDIWETKHFLIRYHLNAENALEFSFKIAPIDQRFETAFMPLIRVVPETMEVEVNDEQVLELIRLWHTEKVFSKDQLSLVNYDLNLLLNHFRELGFSVQPSLLDNTSPLAVDLESEFPLEEAVLDDIFITTMENRLFDFEKKGNDVYEVLLDQNQKIEISSQEDGHTNLFINSEQRKRSLLDFFTSYPFLVPLMVRNS